MRKVKVQRSVKTKLRFSKSVQKTDPEFMKRIPTKHALGRFFFFFRIRNDALRHFFMLLYGITTRKTPDTDVYTGHVLSTFIFF